MWHRVILERHGPWDGLAVTTHYVDASTRARAVLLAVAELGETDEYERLTSYSEVVERPPFDACRECDGRGWMHVHVNRPTEGVEACADCRRYESDVHALEPHADHCACGATVSVGAQWCAECRVPRAEGEEYVEHKGRLLCVACHAREIRPRSGPHSVPPVITRKRRGRKPRAEVNR